MTAANYAGLSRIPLTLIATLVLADGPLHNIVAGAVVVGLAAVSDILDGVLSRRLGTVSAFGAVLDVTTDKIFMCPVLFLVAHCQLLPVWIAVLVTIREFLIMGLRAYIGSVGIVLPAKVLGKLKTILLYPAVIASILGLPGALPALCFAAAVAVISGGSYIWQAWPLISPALCSEQ